MAKFLREEWGEVYLLNQRDGHEYRNPFLAQTNLSQYLPTELSSIEKLAIGASFPGQQSSTSMALALRPCTSMQLYRPLELCEAILIPGQGQQRIIEHPLPEDVHFPSSSARPRWQPLLPLLFVALSALGTWSVCYFAIDNWGLFAAATEHLIAGEKEFAPATNVRIVQLHGTTSENIEAQMFVDANNQQCLIYLYNLPKASTDQTYKLWYYTKEAKFIWAADFQATPRETKVKVEIPAEIRQKVDRVVVSREAKSDASFPVGPIVLRGALR